MKALILIFLITMTTPTHDIILMPDGCDSTNTFIDHSLIGVAPLNTQLCYII